MAVTGPLGAPAEEETPAPPQTDQPHDPNRIERYPSPNMNLPLMNPPELYTPAQVAALFHVDGKTITRWAQEGKLSTIKTLGGHRRYLAAEVNALRNGRQATTPSTSPAPIPSATPPEEGTPRTPIQALVDDHYGGDPLPALLELAGRYGIAIAYLDRPWFTRFVHRGLTDDEWKRITAELDDFCAVLDDTCAGELHDYATNVLRAAHVPTTPGEDE